MTMSHETKHSLDPSTLESLRDLMQINLDSVELYGEAARDVEDDRLRELFENVGAARRRQAEELAAYVVANEESVKDGESFTGQLRRIWMKVHAAIAQKNSHALLAELERGEDRVKHAYEKTVKSLPGSAMSDILHEQLRSVKQWHDEILAQRNAHA